MNESIQNNNDDIEIKLIANFIKRNVSKILSFTGIFFVIAILNIINLKKDYQGTMRLIKNNTKNSYPEIMLKNIIGTKQVVEKDTKSKKTLQYIFRSRYFLEPVFKSYLEDTGNINENFDINSWLNNIEVYFIKNSDVLTITFKDKNKDVLLPTLNKIKNQLNNYSTNLLREDLIEAELVFQSFIQKDSEKINRENINELSKNIKELISKKNLEKINSKITFEKPLEMWDVVSYQEGAINSKIDQARTIIGIYIFIFVLFLTAIYILERLKGKIYSLTALTKNINCKYLFSINLKEEKINKFLLNKYFLENENTSYAIIFLDSIFSKKKSQIYKDLINIEKDLIIEDFSNVNHFPKYKNFYILASTNICSFEDIESINKLISINPKKFLGWINITK